MRLWGYLSVSVLRIRVLRGVCRYVLKVLFFHAGVLSTLAEVPVAADRPCSLLKEDVAAALVDSTLYVHCQRVLSAGGKSGQELTIPS